MSIQLEAGKDEFEVDGKTYPVNESNDSVMYMGKQISKSKAKSELKSIRSAIKSIEDKIKKQGRVTNTRDEDHLKNLFKMRDMLVSNEGTKSV